MESNHKLPTFAELQQGDKELGDKFLELVNKPCPQEWLKNHQFIKVKNSHGQYVPLKYLPIDKVEFLLTRVFGAFYKVEILRESVIFNSVAVAVRLHYCIPGTSVWLFQDGAGAVGAQTDKGEAAANMGQIKADAIQKAFPAALSYAVSNAAARIGKVFGADINKDDAFEFAGTYSQPQQQQQQAAPQFYAPAQHQQPEPTTGTPVPPQPQTVSQPNSFTPQFNFAL